MLFFSLWSLEFIKNPSFLTRKVIDVSIFSLEINWLRKLKGFVKFDGKISNHPVGRCNQGRPRRCCIKLHGANLALPRSLACSYRRNSRRRFFFSPLSPISIASGRAMTKITSHGESFFLLRRACFVCFLNTRILTRLMIDRYVNDWCYYR